MSRIVQGVSFGSVTYNGRGTNSLTEAHECLTATPPLTLEALSWPTQQQQHGEPDEAYRASSQLLVNELLKLNDGPACMRAMIENLHRHLNWQAAFLSRLHSHFASEREIEKWWALITVNFAGRDLNQTWPRAGKPDAAGRSCANAGGNTPPGEFAADAQ